MEKALRLFTLSAVLFLSLCISPAALKAQQTNALKFNGTSGFAFSGYLTEETGNAVTVEMWFAPLSLNRNNIICDFHSDTGIDPKRQIIIYVGADNGISLYCNPNTGDDLSAVNAASGVTVSYNTWYHVAAVCNGTSAKLYVNGTLCIEQAMESSYSLTGSEILILASDLRTSDYGNIAVDEVRVWSREQSLAEISRYMKKPLNGDEHNLYLYYNMNEDGGYDLNDTQFVHSKTNGVINDGVSRGLYAERLHAGNYNVKRAINN